MKKRIIALLLVISVTIGNGEFVYAIESTNRNNEISQENDTENEIENKVENDEKESTLEKNLIIDQKSEENSQSMDDNVDKSNDLTGECGENVQWIYDQEKKELIISGTGAMSDYENNGEEPWTEWKEEICSIVIEPGITMIGKSSFIDCKSLIKIEIPEGLQKIGGKAFYNCKSLTEI